MILESAAAAVLVGLAGILPIWCTSWSAEGFEYAKLLLFRAGVLITIALYGAARLIEVHPLPSGERAGVRGLVPGAVILFLAACAISTISSTLPWTSVFGAYENFMGLVTMAYFGAAFFAASRLLNTEKRLSELVGMMRLAAVACALAAIAERMGWDIFPRALAPDGRTSGFFGNPNYLAGYLVMSLAATLWSLRLSPSPLRGEGGGEGRVVGEGFGWGGGVVLGAILATAFLGVWPPPVQTAGFWLALITIIGGTLLISRVGAGLVPARLTTVAIILAGLIATGSRTGLAVAGLAILLRLVSRAGGRPILRLDRPLLYSGVIILCLGTAIFRPVVTHFWSEWPRAAIWKSAAQMVKERPWTGVGLDTFQQNFERHRGLYWNYEWGRTPSRAHSEPLHLLATTGWIGLIAWVGVWVAWTFSVSRVGETSRSPSFRAATAAVLAYGAFNLIHFPVAATAALFWILLGATSSAGWAGASGEAPLQAHGRGGSPDPPITPLWAWLACLTLAIGGAAWHTVIRPARAEIAYARAILAMRIPLPSGERGRGEGMNVGEGFLRDAVRLAPQEERYWTRLGAVALAAHEPATALWAFEKAARLNPVGALPQMNLAHTLAQMGKPEEALRHAHWACERDPQNVYLHLDRAQILEAVGRREEAGIVRRMAERLYPGKAL